MAKNGPTTEVQKLLNLADEDKNHSSVSFAERFFPKLGEAEKAFSALKTKICDITAWDECGTLNSLGFFTETQMKPANRSLLKTCLSEFP